MIETPVDVGPAGFVVLHVPVLLLQAKTGAVPPATSAPPQRASSPPRTAALPMSLFMVCSFRCVVDIWVLTSADHAIAGPPQASVGGQPYAASS